MDSFVNACLSNAAVASLLGLIAALLPAISRKPRPAVVHSLWLIVFLKLVTPPAVYLPLSISSNRGADMVDELPLEPVVEAEFSEESVEEFDPETVVVAGASPPFEIPWRTILLSVWFMGAGLVWSVAARRAWRFREALRDAAEASEELQDHVAELANRIGISRAPEIRVAPGPVPPMLWGFGLRPILVLPGLLWKQLDGQQRTTLLLHELAHLKRGDHRFRLLELIASGLYWWHPVVWWGRIAVREAEEQCCDAWVVWAMPKQARGYAEALIRALDFISDTGARTPVLASGIGHVSCLKRRIRLIMNARTPKSLSWTSRLLAIALAALLLPVSPVPAQKPAEEATARTEAAQAEAREQYARAKALIDENAAKADAEVRRKVELARGVAEELRAQIRESLSRSELSPEERAKIAREIGAALTREVEQALRRDPLNARPAEVARRLREGLDGRIREIRSRTEAAPRPEDSDSDLVGALRREIAELRERLAYTEQELRRLRPGDADRYRSERPVTTRSRGPVSDPSAPTNRATPRRAPSRESAETPREVPAPAAASPVPVPPPPLAPTAPARASRRTPAAEIAPAPQPVVAPVPPIPPVAPRRASDDAPPTAIRAPEVIPSRENDGRIRELERKLEQVLKELQDIKREPRGRSAPPASPR